MKREEIIDGLEIYTVGRPRKDRVQLQKYIDAIKALEQPRWIPCSEKLPAENITVIGTNKFNDIYKAELYEDCGEKKWYADGNFDVPIVAWIPFPQSYAESENNE